MNRAITTLPLLVLAALLLGSLASCNILGPGLYLLADDRTPAVYQLDPKKTTVIFVDDRNNVLPTRSLRDRIAKSAEKNMLDAKLLQADVISSESLQPVIAAERFSKPRSIAEIGRAVGADQVVYATVDSFTLTPDGSQLMPSAALRVKVIDTKTDTRLFPDHVDGGKDPSFSLAFDMGLKASPLPTSTSERTRAQIELADAAGKRLAELFFKHSSRDPNSRITN